MKAYDNEERRARANAQRANLESMMARLRAALDAERAAPDSRAWATYDTLYSTAEHVAAALNVIGELTPQEHEYYRI